MKNLKLFLTLLAMTAFTFTSCEKGDENLQPVQEQQFAEIEFDITNLGAPSQKSSLESKGDPIETPECKDLSADYVHVKIDGVLYYLEIVSLPSSNNEMQTKVLKLPFENNVGFQTFTITEFAVYHDNNGNTVAPGTGDDEDTVLFASPADGSDNAIQWTLTGVEEQFTVNAFEKHRVDMDVLCYVPADYDEFGFAWFQYAKYAEKHVCFFGDVCSKFWKEWTTFGDEQTNPYYNPNADGYDIPARFSVTINNTTDGSTMNPQIAHNIGLNGEPLCLEFLDNLQIMGETYEAVISLILPDGSMEVIGTVGFDENTYSSDDASTMFGGSDGIYDFSVGDCLNNEDDGDFEFPAWMPIPKTADIILSRTEGDGKSYATATISNAEGNFDLSNVAGALWNGQHQVWCSDAYNGWDSEFVGEFISSLKPESLPDHFKQTLGGSAMDMTIIQRKLNILNYLVNKAYLPSLNTENVGTFGGTVQKLIWKIVHYEAYKLQPTDTRFVGAYDATSLLGVDISNLLPNGLEGLANEIKNFVPGVGDWAIVYIDKPNDLAQMMVMQVDP